MERRRSDAERKKQLEVKKKHMLDHHIAADKLPLKKREEGLSGLLSKLSKQGVRIPADVLSFASTVTARSSREGVGRKKDSDEVGGKTRDGRRRPESALAGEAKQGGKGQKRQIGGDAAATLSRRSSVSSAKRY
uniref:Uncharacterized protein n=1 Tax=Palpitomonas bilix TaxID=652834 RepID=A0A7S3D5F2_9EUKA